MILSQFVAKFVMCKTYSLVEHQLRVRTAGASLYWNTHGYFQHKAHIGDCHAVSSRAHSCINKGVRVHQGRFITSFVSFVRIISPYT